jgi:SAM-dependent methyltransferase
MHPMQTDYVHGYSDRERERLVDQATTLTQLLHGDTRYPPGASVLEAGCGVGAQTVALARNSPGARFTSVDVSAESLDAACSRARAASLENVTFQQADIFALPFPDESFDHVFVCFVLEHLSRPGEALTSLASRLRPGGTLTVIEGDHGSAFFHPDSAEARRAIECLVALQARAGGDALIGRRLFPLLTASGLADVAVSPRMVYVDGSRPQWVEGFTKNTFTAMVEGVGERALAAGLVEAETWRRGVEGLRRTAEPDGVFCYTFFKGIGVKRR